MTRRAASVVDIRDDAASDERADALAIGHPPIWHEHLERVTLGRAMLGYEMPPWLEPRHFFPTQHQRIYEAVLSVGGHVERVNVWLRESSMAEEEGLTLGGVVALAPRHRFRPPVAKSHELAQMCVEAKWLPKSGFPFRVEDIVEYWKQRRLIEACQRVAVKMRHGELSHEGARGELRKHFEEMKR